MLENADLIAWCQLISLLLSNVQKRRQFLFESENFKSHLFTTKCRKLAIDITPTITYKYLEEIVFDKVVHGSTLVVHPEGVKVDVDKEEPDYEDTAS